MTDLNLPPVGFKCAHQLVFFGRPRVRGFWNLGREKRREGWRGGGREGGREGGGDGGEREERERVREGRGWQDGGGRRDGGEEVGGEGREVERDGQDMKEASITWRDRWEMASPPHGSTEYLRGLRGCL